MGGHGIFHWFNQSFLVMLPEIEATFGLNKVQVGAITATREIAGGIVMLPSGVILDILRPYWGIVLSLCMLVFGLGWILTGLSPVYPVILIGMVIVSVASSIWHLPAMGALSHHFQHRKGTALSFHGIGGNLGDFVGPLATGAILTVMTWRGIISVYAVVPLMLTFIVFWAFRDIGSRGGGAAPGKRLAGAAANDPAAAEERHPVGRDAGGGVEGHGLPAAGDVSAQLHDR